MPSADSVRGSVQQLELGTITAPQGGWESRKGGGARVPAAHSSCGVHVEVRGARNLPESARVGTYVCVSVLSSDSQDLPELTIGAVSRLAPHLMFSPRASLWR
jgi:hypothetical protein